LYGIVKLAAFAQIVTLLPPNVDSDGMMISVSALFDWMMNVPPRYVRLDALIHCSALFEYTYSSFSDTTRPMFSDVAAALL